MTPGVGSYLAPDMYPDMHKSCWIDSFMEDGVWPCRSNHIDSKLIATGSRHLFGHCGMEWIAVRYSVSKPI